MLLWLFEDISFIHTLLGRGLLSVMGVERRCSSFYSPQFCVWEVRYLSHNLQVIPAGVAMCASGYLVLQQFPTIGISIVRSSLGWGVNFMLSLNLSFVKLKGLLILLFSEMLSWQFILMVAVMVCNHISAFLYFSDKYYSFSQVSSFVWKRCTSQKFCYDKFQVFCVGRWLWRRRCNILA